MTLLEIFLLLTLVVALLALLVQVASFTFDTAWKISHDNHEHDNKESK